MEERFALLSEKAKGLGYELLAVARESGKTYLRFKHLVSNIEYKWRADFIKDNGIPKTDWDSWKALSELADAAGYTLKDGEWKGVNHKYEFVHVVSQLSYSWRASSIIDVGFPKTNWDFWRELSDAAEENGFELLEPDWLGAHSKHRFRRAGSESLFYWIPNQIKNNGFPCVDGQRYVGQEVCRQIFCRIFGGQFKSNRQILTSIHGSVLELDGFEDTSSFSEDLQAFVPWSGIAFEFQGHQNHREDALVIQRDLLKKKLCDERKILLVQIDPPHWAKVRDSAYMYKFVCSQVNDAVNGVCDIEFPSDFHIQLANWKPDVEQYNELREIANEAGYKLLSECYQGATTLHKFIHCESGLIIEQTPNKIKTRGFNKLHTANSAKEDLAINGKEKYQSLCAKAQASGYTLTEDCWLGSQAKYRFRNNSSGVTESWTPSQIFYQGFPKLPNRYSNTHNLARLCELSIKCGFRLLEDKWLGSHERHRFLHVATKIEYEWTPAQIFTSGFPKYTYSSALNANRLNELGDACNIELIMKSVINLKSDPNLVEKRAGLPEGIQTIQPFSTEYDDEDTPAGEASRPRMRA